ncbi:MAG: DUF58 domain-containing protein [Candidatus Omnitrophica bacterium]|nr:DUF58 domain-containing protein [Candidatus Omnitrophota bacterium]MCM8831917.1 DUF58 domain-containing protein [Candidatus Omnitrophota bacterium]
MIPKEVLRQIRRIQITTSKLVSTVFSGQYKSVFKGKGIEFNEVRPYIFGDDVRFIDWNATARLGQPFIKKFVEERELTVMLLLDVSGSFYFGTTNKLKRELAAEICSALGYLAIYNNDKIGLLIFTKKVEKFIPPKKGTKHLLRIIREALYFKTKENNTDIGVALEYLNKICKRRAVVFIISDFYDDGFEKILSITNKHHDLIAITITDPKELKLPNIGLANFYDPETKNTFTIDTKDENFKNYYTQNSLKLFERKDAMFKKLGIDRIDIHLDSNWQKELFKFFRMREKKLHF